MVKYLSYAGRLQLIKLVLFSLQIYRIRMFILPKKIIKNVERQLSRFLWFGSDNNDASGAKVNWEQVCKLKCVGRSFWVLKIPQESTWT